MTSFRLLLINRLFSSCRGTPDIAFPVCMYCLMSNIYKWFFGVLKYMDEILLRKEKLCIEFFSKIALGCKYLIALITFKLVTKSPTNVMCVNMCCKEHFEIHPGVCQLRNRSSHLNRTALYTRQPTVRIHAL